MNLTKRMLQFVACCVGACAFSAVATDYISDSFEYEGAATPSTFAYTNGLGVVYYKATNNGFNIPSVTNWFTAEGDASTLMTSTFNYGGTDPITNAATHDLVLNLSTEGQTLERKLGSAANFVSEPVYVDTLIKFTASEDAPPASDLTGAKAAVYVNASQSLVVYHGVAGGSPVMTDLGLTVDTNTWHRLTILLGYYKVVQTGESTSKYPAFQLFIDNKVITNSVAYLGTYTDVMPETDVNGIWFKSAAGDGYETLSSVAFKGTGQVDDLWVSSWASGLVPSTAVLLTLSFNDSIDSVLADNVPVVSGGTVSKTAQIVINAKPWNHIVGVTGSGTFTASFQSDNCATGTIDGVNGATLDVAGAINQVKINYGTGIGGVTMAGSSVASGATVPATSNIQIAASDWYRISGYTGAGLYSDSANTGVKTSSGTVTGANNSEITIAAAMIASEQLPSGYGTSATKVKDWAAANNKSEADVAANSASWLDDYLMDVAPDTNAKLQIQSITMVTVDSTPYARVVVTTDKPSVVTPLKNINGTLRYCTTDTLGSAFSPIAAIDVSAAEGATVTVDIPVSGAGSFVKITLQ